MTDLRGNLGALLLFLGFAHSEVEDTERLFAGLMRDFAVVHGWQVAVHIAHRRKIKLVIIRPTALAAANAQKHTRKTSMPALRT